MKRKRAYQLFEAIGGADDQQLEHSEQKYNEQKHSEQKHSEQKHSEQKHSERKHSEQKGRHWTWKKKNILAACLAAVLLVGAGGYACIMLITHGRLGAYQPGGNSNGHDEDGSSVFMSYAGPVFPLTTLEGGEGLTAVRDICLDFSPWLPKEGDRKNSTNIIVTDSYTLTNPSTEDKTVEVLYPFMSPLYDISKNMATLEIDGKILDTKIYAGVYSGGFRGALEGEEEQKLWQLDSWEKYRLLLSDGSYLEKTLSSSFQYSDYPVIVYRFINEYGPEPTEDIPNPTLRMMFSLDFEKTTVLSYNFSQHSFDWKNNIAGLGFSVPRAGAIDYGEPHYMIVMGDDIKDLDIKGYVTGGWDTKKTLENIGAEFTREETNLEVILREIAEKEWNNYLRNVKEYLRRGEEAYTIDYERYYQLFCDYLESFGFPDDDVFIQYNAGALESTEVFTTDRVCYAAAQIEIPAGGSIVLKAVMAKDGSFDYMCGHTENEGIYGYDMVTALGTNLALQESYATIEDYGQIEIVRQNFGFDLAENIRTVLLDMQKEHYYLEVKPVEAE